MPTPREVQWNQTIVLQLHDRLFARIIAPLIPRWVKPNHITVFRMLMTPVVVVTVAVGNFAAGVPLFLFVALTDAFDGMLARVRREITEWGTVFDPIADKLLIGSVLFVIVFGHMNAPLGYALLAVEAASIAVGALRARRGLIVPANRWGKIKMVVEVAGLCLLLAALWLGIDLFVDLSMGTFALAIVFAIVSIYSSIK